MKKEEKVLEVLKTEKIIGREIDIYNSIDNPLFLASDVANWIGVQNVSQMIKQADIQDSEKGIFLKYTLGGNQKLLFVTEDATYDILFSSRKPDAKLLRREIKQRLKQIRLTGGYVETDRESEFIDKYFPSFTEETKLAMVQDLQKQNQEYKEQIAKLEPKAKAYMDLMEADGYLQFLDISAMVEIGRSTLLAFLRKCKVLTKQSNYNVPYGRFNNNGMFKVITSTTESGHISSVTMVSPKGLQYIYKLMKKKDMLDKFNTATLLSKIKEIEVA